MERRAATRAVLLSRRETGWTSWHGQRLKMGASTFKLEAEKLKMGVGQTKTCPPLRVPKGNFGECRVRSPSSHSQTASAQNHVGQLSLEPKTVSLLGLNLKFSNT